MFPKNRLMICTLLCMCSCLAVQEIPYLNTPKENMVLLSGSSGRTPNLWYSVRVDDSLWISVYVLRQVDLKERRMPGVLLVDLAVSPGTLRKQITYRPERIRVVIFGDTLHLLKSRVTCSYPNTCYHRAIFNMSGMDAKSGVYLPDSVWCQVDLKGALEYRGVPIEFGPLVGRLPQ